MKRRNSVNFNTRTMRYQRGFTLIEAALATVIIGVGFLASLQLFAACTMQNQNSAQMTTAMLLATNIEETMADLSFNDPGTAAATFGKEAGEVLVTFDDIDDFDGFDSFTTPSKLPIDSTRSPITGMEQYSQVVTVRPVYVSRLSVNSSDTVVDIPKTTYTGAARVTVKVMFRPTPGATPEEVYRTSWIRVDR